MIKGLESNRMENNFNDIALGAIEDERQAGALLKITKMMIIMLSDR